MNDKTNEKILSDNENLRILFVDDETLLFNSFKRFFTKSDFIVDVAKSGEEGLNLLKEHEYAVIISDYRMPGIDGIQFLKRVSENQPGASRILCSGRADLETVMHLINQVGLFKFISKPWDSDKLVNSVYLAAERFKAVLKNRNLSKALSDKISQLNSLKQNLEKTVQRRTSNLLSGLINALDLRDTETQWHSRRVALYARKLAGELGIYNNDLLNIERGALLHDIGKVGISDKILLKPGKLTDEEMEIIRQHSGYGYKIVEKIEFLGNARQIIYQHHESWDGNGYPHKLKGEKIILGARIFAIIDTFDAMTSDRPYRKALSYEIAMEEIERKKGIQFDPDIADKWLALSLSEIKEIRKNATSVNAGLD